MPLEKADIAQYVKFASCFKNIPQRDFYLSFDSEADVVYINFQNPAEPADDSEFRDDDTIVRYNETGGIIGLTILHASKRGASLQLQSPSPADALSG